MSDGMPIEIKCGISFLVAAGLLWIGWKYTPILVTLHVLVCFVLVLVIMLQSGNAADLAGAFHRAETGSTYSRSYSLPGMATGSRRDKPPKVINGCSDLQVEPWSSPDARAAGIGARRPQVEIIRGSWMWASVKRSGRAKKPLRRREV